MANSTIYLKPVTPWEGSRVRLFTRGDAAISYNEHLARDGPVGFEDACRLGLEGIVSEWIDSLYRSGPSKVWRKSKNPQCEPLGRYSPTDDIVDVRRRGKPPTEADFPVSIESFVTVALSRAG
jgi:hypothetical protein